MRKFSARSSLRAVHSASFHNYLWLISLFVLLFSFHSCFFILFFLLLAPYYTTIDNDESIVHGVLTENNLFDGSIITPTDSYYIEPSTRYSAELIKNGIHSIVYKIRDVDMLPNGAPNKSHRMHCASQRLHEKLRGNSDNEIDSHSSRRRTRRWLEDEVNSPMISISSELLQFSMQF